MTTSLGDKPSVPDFFFIQANLNAFIQVLPINQFLHYLVTEVSYKIKTSTVQGYCDIEKALLFSVLTKSPTPLSEQTSPQGISP